LSEVNQAVKTIHLANGLMVEIHDNSRKIAGDRWRVEFVARIPVPVQQKWFDSMTSMPVSIIEIQKTLGVTVAFEYRNVRNFVDYREKKAVFEQMDANFIANLKPYCEHPAFAARFILREYKTRQQKQKLLKNGNQTAHSTCRSDPDC
jgi:hypothetical protein